MSIAALIDNPIEALLNGAVVNKKKKLTKEEQAECARLKKAWLRQKDVVGIASQEKLGEVMGFSQGMVTQHMNAHTRIGDLALFKYSFHLAFDPEEVRPGFYREHPELMVDDRQLSRDEVAMLASVRKLQSLGGDVVSAFESFLDALETNKSK
jgi:predicted alpha/beta-hydrolase family hydrolase